MFIFSEDTESVKLSLCALRQLRIVQEAAVSSVHVGHLKAIFISTALLLPASTKECLMPFSNQNSPTMNRQVSQ